MLQTGRQKGSMPEILLGKWEYVSTHLLPFCIGCYSLELLLMGCLLHKYPISKGPMAEMPLGEGREVRTYLPTHSQ